LRGSGFAPLRVHHVLLEHNLFGMWQSSITSHASSSISTTCSSGNAHVKPLDLVVSMPGLALAPVAALLELAAGICRRGGTIAVLARLESSSAGYH
jgi:hypothetical protein